MSEALSNTKSGKFKHVQKKESMKRPSSPLLTRSSRAVLMVGYACGGHVVPMFPCFCMILVKEIPIRLNL